MKLHFAPGYQHHPISNVTGKGQTAQTGMEALCISPSIDTVSFGAFSRTSQAALLLRSNQEATAKLVSGLLEEWNQSAKFNATGDMRDNGVAEAAYHYDFFQRLDRVENSDVLACLTLGYLAFSTHGARVTGTHFADVLKEVREQIDGNAQERLTDEQLNRLKDALGEDGFTTLKTSVEAYKPTIRQNLASILTAFKMTRSEDAPWRLRLLGCAPFEVPDELVCAVTSKIPGPTE